MYVICEFWPLGPYTQGMFLLDSTCCCLYTVVCTWCHSATPLMKSSLIWQPFGLISQHQYAWLHNTFVYLPITVFTLHKSPLPAIIKFHDILDQTRVRYWSCELVILRYRWMCLLKQLSSCTYSNTFHLI